MKKVLMGVVSIVIIVIIVLKFGISDQSEYKMCLGAQGISNTIAKVLVDEPTNACNE
jgi:hypothetical protein